MVDVAKSGEANIYQGKKYSCVEELILKQGMAFHQEQTTAKWQKSFEDVLISALGKVPEPNLAYCEGFALQDSSPLPVLTAWIWTGDKIIVPKKGIYIGIPFHPDFVLERYLETGQAGVFQSDACSKYPLLDYGVSPNKIVRMI